MDFQFEKVSTFPYIVVHSVPMLLRVQTNRLVNIVHLCACVLVSTFVIDGIMLPQDAVP